jgi:hypothetical protein
MELQLSNSLRFSSTVRLILRTEGSLVELAGIGPSEIFLRSPVELDPGIAEIFMEVDGQTFAWPVTLVRGAVPFDRVVEIASRGDIQRLGQCRIPS